MISYGGEPKPTRQADWEAGRDAATKVAEDVFGMHSDNWYAFIDHVCALSYPGPSGAKMPTESEGASPTELRIWAERARASRQAWLESYGVPISNEFAQFAEAIGTLIELAETFLPTRQADWEAGRDDAIKIVAHEFPSIGLLAKIRALKYPGPSGAQDAPTDVIPGVAGESPCTGCGEGMDGAFEEVVQIAGHWWHKKCVNKGAQDAPRPQSVRQKARQLVNSYEDRRKHLRGHYSRTDLLAIVIESQAKEGE